MEKYTNVLPKIVGVQLKKEVYMQFFFLRGGERGGGGLSAK